MGWQGTHTRASARIEKRKGEMGRGREGGGGGDGGGGGVGKGRWKAEEGREMRVLRSGMRTRKRVKRSNVIRA